MIFERLYDPRVTRGVPTQAAFEPFHCSSDGTTADSPPGLRNFCSSSQVRALPSYAALQRVCR